MKNIHLSFLCLVLLLLNFCSSDKKKKVPDGEQEISKEAFNEAFVEVSKENSAYFQLSTGDTYIPIGLNICWAGGGMTELEQYFRRLSENGGNFARVWIGQPMFDYETVYGQVNQDQLAKLDQLLEIADKYGIKVKLCIDNFRKIEPENPTGDFTIKSVYHIDNGGSFTSMDDYMSDERGKNVFLKKVRLYKERYGDNPHVFAWEIWNEMNAIFIEDLTEKLIPWNRSVLKEMQNIFPKNLVTQSLGSMDGEWCFSHYDGVMKIADNDFLQVHRYLDEGAHLEICRAPVDILAADAIAVLQSYGQNKPVLLAESGGVKPNHTGPHTAYTNDKFGMIFHDVLFAPFFAGAAGPGHIWHWDAYINQNDVWFQIQRFVNAINGVDPVVEGFEPVRTDQNGLKVYVLKGKKTSMLWIRDSENTWQSELIEGNAPKLLSNVSVNLSDVMTNKKITKVEIYDPWNDKWSEKSISGQEVVLPDFSRSLVLKIRH